MEKQPIYEDDWDYLIVLDACRYDYFREIYEKFFIGNLKKVRSRGSHTTEWVENTFTRKMKDVTYISTNPHINNLGKSLKETSNIESDWKATDFFGDIFDVWAKEEFWNDNLGTVLPQSVNKAVKEGPSSGQLIIHYIQPHQPYVDSKNKHYEWFGKKRVEDPKKENKSLSKKIIRPFFHLLPKKTQIKIKHLCGYNLSPLKELVAKNKIDKLEQLYRKNLEIALRSIWELIPDLDGKIIITSDHGEAFGEDGEWGHSRGVDIPILRTVPWFEVEGIKEGVETQTLKTESKNKEDGNNSSEEKIKEKLEALGYKT